MSTDMAGMIECRPGARLWGPDDEDSVWQAGIDLWLLNTGNAYDALACLLGVRNTFGFRPLSGTRSRRSVAGNATHWGPVWKVMSTLSEVHGPESVRLVVWFF